MAKLTFKNLSDGISLALSRAYPKANVFCKKALQQVSPGDFNVVPVSIIPLEKLNTLAKYKVLFDIIYFPREGDECDDCLRVATDLPLILETIETPGGAKVHCINDITINIVDEVLHCSATYQYVVFARRVPAIGKRLKKGFVPGKRMLEISEQELEALAPKILQDKLEKFLKGVFNG